MLTSGSRLPNSALSTASKCQLRQPPFSAISSLARIKAAANARPWLANGQLTGWAASSLSSRRPRRLRRVKLRAPKKRLLDDAHYHHVAEAYRGAVGDGLSPAKTLADESGVPQGTVNRWIAESRRRGYLPPGVPGRRTRRWL